MLTRWIRGHTHVGQTVRLWLNPQIHLFTKSGHEPSYSSNDSMGEILGLLIQDLEFHRNGIWIRRRSGLENGALAKSLVEGEERFIDLSPALMALLDHLLQHSFDTDHLFVVLKRNAKDKWGNSTYSCPLGCEAVKGLFRYYSQKSGIPILMRDYPKSCQPSENSSEFFKFPKELKTACRAAI